MRKTSVPAPFGGLMIAGVVVAVAAPFLGWILQALALLINSYWSIPCWAAFCCSCGALWAGYSTDEKRRVDYEKML